MPPGPRLADSLTPDNSWERWFSDKACLWWIPRRVCVDTGVKRFFLKNQKMALEAVLAWTRRAKLQHPQSNRPRSMRRPLLFGIALTVSTVAVFSAHPTSEPWTNHRGSAVGLSSDTDARERAEPPRETRRGGQRGEEAPRLTEDEQRRAEEWRERRAATRAGRIGGPIEAVGFSDADRLRIAAIPLEQYPPGVRRRITEGRDLPPGVAGRLDRERGLPEGWRQRLEPGFVLESDLERGVLEIPRRLRRRLPPVPPDHEDILLGDRLVRVMRHSREIVDSVPVGPGRAARVETPAETGAASAPGGTSGTRR